MASFEFNCERCGRFEAIRRFEEIATVKCPACKGKVRRVYSPVNFSFGFVLSDRSLNQRGAPVNEFVKNI